MSQNLTSPTLTPTTPGIISILGLKEVRFDIPTTNQSTVPVDNPLAPPKGTTSATIALTGFDVQYSNQEQFGFGELAVLLTVPEIDTARATVTLRDNNVNKRQWLGTITGLVTFYGQNR